MSKFICSTCGHKFHGSSPCSLPAAPVKLHVPTTIDIIRCPAEQCVCSRAAAGTPGGALLCKLYRPTAQTGGVLEMACPRAKGSLIRIVIGGGSEVKP